ncbi:DMT family transporter [Phaeovulum sp.]|uniref:DMT family transporter n=1 Tax=Phaeovulum sp. TaxID=2934796 RepID=UPI0039E2924D
MRSHPLFGLLLALFGALVLTPDTLFMRLSGMSGFQMVGWRGLLMGSIMLFVWVVSSRNRRGDIGAVISGAGLIVIACQFTNSTLFNLAIATAPVTIVLFAVATSPIFAAIFARIVFNEPTRRATWITIVAVLTGIGIAMFGKETGGIGIDLNSALGAMAGLCVAAALAFYFVMLRHHPQLPLLLVMGVGVSLAGVTGLVITGPGAMTNGTVWPIIVTGAVILPLSFGALSLASRHTQASNVSLLILLETVFGPLWVWWGVDEAPTPAMLLGGAIVIGSIAIYLWASGRSRPRIRTLRPMGGTEQPAPHDAF